MLKWSNDPYVGLDIAKIFDIEKHRSGDTAMLSGLVCAFHPAALGLSPKHTIYAFIHLLKYCTVEKTKINKKRPGLAYFFLKTSLCKTYIHPNGLRRGYLISVIRRPNFWWFVAKAWKVVRFFSANRWSPNFVSRNFSETWILGF